MRHIKSSLNELDNEKLYMPVEYLISHSHFHSLSLCLFSFHFIMSFFAFCMCEYGMEIAYIGSDEEIRHTRNPIKFFSRRGAEVMEFEILLTHI